MYLVDFYYKNTCISCTGLWLSKSAGFPQGLLYPRGGGGVFAIRVKKEGGGAQESVRKVYRKEKPLAAAGNEEKTPQCRSHHTACVITQSRGRKRKLLTARRKEICEFVIILYTDGPTNKVRIHERFPPKSQNSGKNSEACMWNCPRAQNKQDTKIPV